MVTLVCNKENTIHVYMYSKCVITEKDTSYTFIVHVPLVYLQFVHKLNAKDFCITATRSHVRSMSASVASPCTVMLT